MVARRGQKRLGSELMGRGLADLDSNYHSSHALHVLLLAASSLVHKYNLVWSETENQSRKSCVRKVLDE